MLPKIDGHYLFILPLPANAPTEHNASLYGICYAYTDANFNIIGNKEIITCKGLCYKLPSPSYLFAQGIDPNTIRQGLSEHDFYKKVTELLTAPNTDIFTWSVRNLKILEKISLRLIEPNVLSRINSLVDINKLLKLNEYFETGLFSKSDSLVNYAKKLGFNQKIDFCDPKSRLDMLLYVVKYLNQNESALLNYSLQGKTYNINKTRNAIEKNTTLLDYNPKLRLIQIVKPVAIIEPKDGFEALVTDGDKLTHEFISFSNFGILSPSTVLTEKRQQITHFDLNAANKALYSADIKSLPLNESTLPLYDKLIKLFNKADLKLYDEYLRMPKNALDRPPLSCSKTFRELVFILRGNNFRGTMTDQELSYFYKMCANLIQNQARAYAKELNNLQNNINENDEDQLALFAKIQAYPTTL